MSWQKRSDGVLTWCEQATHHIPFDHQCSTFDLSVPGLGLALDGGPDGGPIDQILEMASLHFLHNSETTRNNEADESTYLYSITIVKTATRRTSVRVRSPHRIDSPDLRVANVQLEPNNK